MGGFVDRAEDPGGEGSDGPFGEGDEEEEALVTGHGWDSRDGGTR